MVVGALLILDSTANPATLYSNTTWSKIENRFLYGSASPSATGGRSSVALALANIPVHNHSATQGGHTHSANHNHTATQASHLHTQPSHTHRLKGSGGKGISIGDQGYNTFNNSSAIEAAGGENTGSATPAITVNTTNVTTSSSTPSISVGNTGSGTSFDIMPPYYTVCIWKRLS
ncbi:MAG: phage baseplate protein [Cetobacterium sp.]